MLKVLGLAGVVMIALNAPLIAGECPIESLDVDQVERAITAAPSCQAAHRMMNDCRRNASSDVELARIVIGKCESRFVSRLSSARKKAYETERGSCGTRYATTRGTMGASFQATCEAGVAAKFAR